MELIWAGVAVPVAALLGLAALGAARAGRRRAQLTLRRSGARTAVAGQVPGSARPPVRGHRRDFPARVRDPELAGTDVGESANRLYNRRACSRSATASEKPGSARAWSSPTSSGRPRSAAKYLRALEDEQFELLPAQTYVKGFLNTYAEFLGLDGQLYVDEYNSRYVTREEEEPFRPRRSTPHARNRRLESSVVLVTLVGIAVVFGLVIACVEVGRRLPEHERADRRHRLRAPAERVLVVARHARRDAHGGVAATRRKASSSSPARSRTDASSPSRSAQKLWLYVQRPAAVDLVVNGRATRAPARLLFVDASGVERAPAAN